MTVAAVLLVAAVFGVVTPKTLQRKALLLGLTATWVLTMLTAPLTAYGIDALVNAYGTMSSSSTGDDSGWLSPATMVVTLPFYLVFLTIMLVAARTKL